MRPGRGNVKTLHGHEYVLTNSVAFLVRPGEVPDIRSFLRLQKKNSSVYGGYKDSQIKNKDPQILDFFPIGVVKRRMITLDPNI